MGFKNLEYRKKYNRLYMRSRRVKMSAENKEKIKRHNIEYKKQLRDEMTVEQRNKFYKEKYKKSYKSNPIMHAKRNLEAYHNLRRKVFEKLGNRCANNQCQWINPDNSKGCLDIRCLQIDHVKGDGVEDRKKVGVSSTFLRKVLKDETNSYQLLCANCNWIKRVDNREHIK